MPHAPTRRGTPPVARSDRGNGSENPSAFSTPSHLTTTHVHYIRAAGPPLPGPPNVTMVHQLHRTQCDVSRTGGAACNVGAAAARARRPVLPGHSRRRNLADQPDGERARRGSAHQVFPERDRTPHV